MSVDIRRRALSGARSLFCATPKCLAGKLQPRVSGARKKSAQQIFGGLPCPRLADLKSGDFVVHVNHGIAKYGGGAAKWAARSMNISRSNTTAPTGFTCPSDSWIARRNTRRRRCRSCSHAACWAAWEGQRARGGDEPRKHRGMPGESRKAPVAPV